MIRSLSATCAAAVLSAAGAFATATAAKAQDDHGCVHEDTLESHVGHVLWCWDDTPHNHGLLATALVEGAIALKYATLAVADPTDVEAMRQNLAYVVHALDPAEELEGEGLGYGLVLAAESAAVHIGFALQAETSFGIDTSSDGDDNDGYGYGDDEADDLDTALDQMFDETPAHETSETVRAHAALATLSLANASAWSVEMLAVAKLARAQDDPGSLRLGAEEVLAVAIAVMNGRDLNGDGTISAEAGEGGLNQAREAMMAIVAEEGLNAPGTGSE